MEIRGYQKGPIGRRLSQFAGIAELSSGNSIVWSGLTGFIGIVPRHLAEKLKTGEFDDTDPELAALEDEGLFFTGNEDEALVDVLESLARTGSQPTHYRLVLTEVVI